MRKAGRRYIRAAIIGAITLAILGAAPAAAMAGGAISHG
jgi:hypothetical protein